MSDIIQCVNMNESNAEIPHDLVPAIRQYRHNIGGDEFVIGLDYDLTVAAFRKQQAEIAALRSQLEAMQWRPIESAPRDGTRILGWYDDFYDVGTGEFVTVYYHAIPYGSWFETTGMPIDSAPDKWMPLPPVPDKPEV